MSVVCKVSNLLESEATASVDPKEASSGGKKKPVQKRKSLYDMKVLRRSRGHELPPRSHSSFVDEWRGENDRHAKELEGDVLNKVTWEHVLAAVQSIGCDEDVCGISRFMGQYGDDLSDSGITEPILSRDTCGGVAAAGTNKRQKVQLEHEGRVTDSHEDTDCSVPPQPDDTLSGGGQNEIVGTDSSGEASNVSIGGDDDEAILAYMNSQLQYEHFGVQRRTPVEVCL